MEAAAKMRAQEECLRVDTEKSHVRIRTESCALRRREAWVINKVQMATVKKRNMSFPD